MTFTQTIEVPTDHRLTIDVPPEVPVGQAVIAFTPVSVANEGMSAERENELFRLHADELNAEAEDVLLFQDIDAFEEDLERLAQLELAVVRDASVTFSLADIATNRDGGRPNRTPGEGGSL